MGFILSYISQFVLKIFLAKNAQNSTQTQAFQDLQTKKLERQRDLFTIDAQIGFGRQRTRRAELAKLELEKLPAQVPTYESVGRMFVRQSRDDALAQIDQQFRAASDEVRSCEVAKLQTKLSVLGSKIAAFFTDEENVYRKGDQGGRGQYPRDGSGQENPCFMMCLYNIYTDIFIQLSFLSFFVVLDMNFVF